jgi:pimeloyl-ACP methyl ester carboxylesterase
MTATTASTIPERDVEATLPDGRTLSGAVLGDLDATRTVVVLDGPGSRGLARVSAAAAAEEGVRLIAPDRPGFLRSTPVAEPTFSGVAADVLALADHLGAERFGVLGQSGGTPYALALAAAAPDRVTALAFTGPISPLGEPGAMQDVGGPMKPALVLARRAPFLLGPLFGVAARQAPEKTAKRVRDGSPGADQRILEDPRLWDAHLRTTREVLASPKAMAREARLLPGPWDVDLAAIRAPVAIWVGERDETHPPGMARRLAARLGDPPVRVVPDVGTFGLFPLLGEVVAFAARGA